MEIANVLLIGGSGFVGSCIARQLSARGLRVVVPTRRRERAKHLILLPTVEVVEADVHDPASLQALCAGQDAVISLVGILQSRRGTPVRRGLRAGACRTAEEDRRGLPADRRCGASCTSAHSRRRADAPSMYLRSKADGEAAIRAGAPDIATTIVQPSVIFGAGDSFLNLFAELARRVPVLPLASPERPLSAGVCRRRRARGGRCAGQRGQYRQDLRIVRAHWSTPCANWSNTSACSRAAGVR